MSTKEIPKKRETADTAKRIEREEEDDDEGESKGMRERESMEE